MTVSNTYSDSALVAGNGVTVAFTTRCIFTANSDLEVYLVLASTGVETLQTITTHYTLAGAGTGAAGTVTFVTAPTSLQQVKIRRVSDLLQGTDYQENTSFPATTHETVVDKLTLELQELNTKISRAPLLRASSSQYPLTLPDGGTGKEGYILRWDSTNGTTLEAVSPVNAALTTALTPTDDNFIVGNGTAFVTESGATARASLGVTIGTQVQGYDATLAALAAYNTAGLLTQTAADTFTGRTLTGTAAEITLTNGDGVSGNPTVSLPSALTFTGKTITGGTYASPALTTPTLGVASATTVNKVTLTAPATGATLTITDGKTLTASNTLTFTGTDASSVAFGTGGTVAYTANKLSAFAATTSSELAGTISDETGSGALVFATSPTLVTPVLGAATATSINGQVHTAKTTTVGDNIIFAEGTNNGTNTLTLQCPASIATNYTFTLPVNVGTAGYVLKTDGAGLTSWTAPSAATAGGSTTQVQYNDTGAFAGAAGFTFDGTGTITTTVGNIIGGNAGAAGFVRLLEATGNGANYIQIKAPAAVTTNTTLTLPNGPGTAGYVLSDTDGAGTLGWIAASSVTAAAQSDQETATSTTTYVSPGRQQFHPSAAKAWGTCDLTGALQMSYNLSSVTDTSASIKVFNFTTSFSAATYTATIFQYNSGSAAYNPNLWVQSRAVGAATCYNADEGTNNSHFGFTAFGDQ